MAGRGPLAGMLPYSDANAVVVDMVSPSPVLPRPNRTLLDVKDSSVL